jgi:hypothetical protein
MNVSSIAPAAAPYASPSNAAGADFKSLAQALQSGDLAGAQQAWSTLKQDAPWIARASSSSAASSTTSTSPIASALQTLGSALQSGDAVGAQQAFSSLQQAMQSAHHGHHHHRASQSTAPSQPATSSTAPAGGVDTLA